jgi:hypothetical protein
MIRMNILCAINDKIYIIHLYYIILFKIYYYYNGVGRLRGFKILVIFVIELLIDKNINI